MRLQSFKMNKDSGGLIILLAILRRGQAARVHVELPLERYRSGSSRCSSSCCWPRQSSAVLMWCNGADTCRERSRYVPAAHRCGCYATGSDPRGRGEGRERQGWEGERASERTAISIVPVVEATNGFGFGEPFISYLPYWTLRSGWVSPYGPNPQGTPGKMKKSPR